jgi:hypothetical protein
MRQSAEIEDAGRAPPPHLPLIGAGPCMLQLGV